MLNISIGDIISIFMIASGFITVWVKLRSDVTRLQSQLESERNSRTTNFNALPCETVHNEMRSGFSELHEWRARSMTDNVDRISEMKSDVDDIWKDVMLLKAKVGINGT